jgi:anti-sigma regulatory factor (Ser/Thr protein kinase)
VSRTRGGDTRAAARSGDPYDVPVSSAASRFSPVLASVPQARRFLREVLHGWHAQTFEWGASQVLTELVTNAVLHAGTEIEVTVSLEGDQLRIQVADGSARSPLARPHRDSSTTGRGMAMVEALSRSWGTAETAAGKVVWALVDADEVATQRPAGRARAGGSGRGGTTAAGTTAAGTAAADEAAAGSSACALPAQALPARALAA